MFHFIHVFSLEDGEVNPGVAGDQKIETRGANNIHLYALSKLDSSFVCKIKCRHVKQKLYKRVQRNVLEKEKLRAANN
jgi:hypothetical protein